jgi:NAD(P)-dependent dehydrogenase (short-subunit alcohol dehydrogenase family)
MGEVTYVIGTGPGLGAAVARRFARERHAVALMARSQSSLAPALDEVKKLGARAAAYEVDATRASAVKDAFARARADLGPADVLVYNAGAFKMGGILDFSPEEFDECWRANCAGALYAAQAVLPDMLAKKKGTILLTGATAAMRGSAKFACLAVGKFGLRALGQSMAREFGPQGIHVAHVVVDGQIDTPRMRAFAPDRPKEQILAPDAIAETYWHLHTQHPTSWTLEIDVRPAVERF